MGAIDTSTKTVGGYDIKFSPIEGQDKVRVTVAPAIGGPTIAEFDAASEAEIKSGLGKVKVFAGVPIDLGTIPGFGTKVAVKFESSPPKAVPLDRKDITPQFIASLTPKDMEAMTPSDKKRLLSVVATMDPKQLTGKTLDNAVVIAAMDKKSGVDITTNSASELQTTLKANLFQHKAEVKSGPFEVPGQKPYVLDVKPDGSFTAVGVHVYNDAEAAAAGSSKETLMSGAFYNFCEKAYPGLDTAQVSTLIKGPLKKQYEAYMKGGDVTFPPSVDATPPADAKAPALETKGPTGVGSAGGGASPLKDKGTISGEKPAELWLTDQTGKAHKYVFADKAQAANFQQKIATSGGIAGADSAFALVDRGSAPVQKDGKWETWVTDKTGNAHCYKFNTEDEAKNFKANLDPAQGISGADALAASPAATKAKPAGLVDKGSAPVKAADGKWETWITDKKGTAHRYTFDDENAAKSFRGKVDTNKGIEGADALYAASAKATPPPVPALVDKGTPHKLADGSYELWLTDKNKQAHRYTFKDEAQAKAFQGKLDPSKGIAGADAAWAKSAH
ncbi:MAG: hypothetical protein IT381_26370 [Deltaproteobacteria bacterium]|nr:hypothetical protein [Deltaproteobacteria bacterium]